MVALDSNSVTCEKNTRRSWPRRRHPPFCGPFAHMDEDVDVDVIPLAATNDAYVGHC